MAQVPYQPVPEERPAPSQGIDVPAGAFGGGVAKAIAGAGQDVQQAGSDIYGRAVEMQKQKIEADVNDRVVQFFKDRGDLDNTFRNMQGASPQENLAAHKAALEGAYTAGRKGIPSLYGQNMYDRDTRRQLAYDFTNSGLYAATELKKYNKQSYEFKQLTMADQAAKDPNNMLALNTAIKNVTDDEARIGASEGSPPEMVKAQTARKVASLIGTVASSKAIRDPDGAMKLLETSKDNKELFPNGMPADIYQKALETITSRSIQYHAALDARTFSGGTVLPANSPAAQSADSIRKIAERNGWGADSTFTPENIHKLVVQEGGMNNPAPNQYGYAGYFQMKPKEFGLTPQDFKKMSFEQQLELYAGSYLKKYGYTGTQDLGVMNAAPAFGGAADDAVAYPAGSKEAAANPAWVRYSGAGGSVTVGGIKAWLQGGGTGLSREPEVTLPAIAASATEMAKARFPDDAISQERYFEQVMSNSKRNSTLMRSQINNQIKENRTGIDSVLFQVGERGRGPRTVEEAMAINPNFQQMWEDAALLNPSITKHINDTFNYNSKSDVPMTKERHDRYQAALGQSITDPEAFDKLSIAGLDLPFAQNNQLFTKQLTNRKKGEDITKMRSYLSEVQPQLADAGIFANNPGVYNQFVGAYSSEIEEAQKKKPTTYQERQEIAAKLIRDRGGFMGFFTTRDYEVPQSFMTDELRNKFEKQHGHPPTPAETYRLYQLSKTQ